MSASERLTAVHGELDPLASWRLPAASTKLLAREGRRLAELERAAARGSASVPGHARRIALGLGKAADGLPRGVAARVARASVHLEALADEWGRG